MYLISVSNGGSCESFHGFFSRRFEQVPLMTPNGDCLVSEISFEVIYFSKKVLYVIHLSFVKPDYLKSQDLEFNDQIDPFLICFLKIESNQRTSMSVVFYSICRLFLQVKSGLNVLVCGPNGCGKSSLFRVLGEVIVAPFAFL